MAIATIARTGAIAFAPVPGNLSTEKGPKWHHGLTPKVREPERERFEGAKQFGIEVYKDENTGGLVYLAETGALSAGPAPATPPEKNKVADPKHSHGLVLMIRKADEADKRVTHIGVTQEVRDYVRDTMPRLSIHPLVEALGRASAAQRRAIVEGLKTLRTMLEDP